MSDTEDTKTLTLYKFTNHQNSSHLDGLLAIFYRAVDANLLGIMTAYNKKLEREELILVGLELDEDNKPVCYPLTKVLTSEEIGDYQAPDGKGGFLDMAAAQ